MDGIKTKCISFWQILSSKGAGLVCVSLLFTCLEGSSPHLAKPQQLPSIAASYRLIDLGEIDTTINKLSKFHDELIAAPAINDAGEVIANAKSGGIFIRPDKSRYTPKIGDARLEFRAINNQGDLLVAVRRGRGETHWVVWAKQGKPKCISFDLSGFRGDETLFSLMNDGRWVVGEGQTYGFDYPLLWTSTHGLRAVGFSNLKCTLRQLSDEGAIAGILKGNVENPPFIWDPQKGLVVLDKYRRAFDPELQGRIEFADLILSPEGVVYGTYWINDQLQDARPTASTPFGSFVWLPFEKEFFLTNEDGMRMAQINSSNRVVGQLRGKAALREPGLMPVPLSAAAVLEDLAGWDLLEATGINKKGQIVGFGLLNGKLHLFRADPLS